MKSKNPEMEKIISLCKRRGFVFPASEIYGGWSNAYTFGPLGAELKKNIKDFWWKNFVQMRADVVGLDGEIILHPKVWHASGHAGAFSDQMVDCKKCRARIRADHLIEDALGMDVEGFANEEMTEILQENQVPCPECGSKDLTDVRQFNLMFSTQMAKIAKTQKDGEIDLGTAFLRPETAQAIFIEFKNILDCTRQKVPFGIAQIGKAFRNEITPGHFIFRKREFEQMEIEFFVHESQWQTHFENWRMACHNFCADLGLDLSKLHELEVGEKSRAHYSKRTIDFEFDFPFGRSELFGIAYRGDYDLSNHQKSSGKPLTFRDEATGETFLPHVIEPSFGLDRMILAVLCSAFHEQILENGETRTVLALDPKIAPVQIVVLPLLKKDGLAERATEIFESLRGDFRSVELEISGTIGKRYRRADEIGVPASVVVDHQTLETGEVTVRDRDSMESVRVATAELKTFLQQKYFA